MIRKRLLRMVIVGVAMLTMVVLSGYPMTIGAAEKSEAQCTVIDVQSKAGLSRPMLHVKKGDCVVWLNRSRGEDFRIVFKEGKKCQDMTESPVGFRMDWKSCYVTDYLDFGRTSSLVFSQAGTFKYEIELEAAATNPLIERTGFERFGTIIVE
jgi:hypothetical protein